MTKLKLARAAVAASSAMVLSLGVVGIASAHSQEWSMPQNDSSVVSAVHNNNDVNVKNTNKQNATSGESEVEHNQDGGNAATGNTANGNSTGVGVAVSNPKSVTPAPAAPVGSIEGVSNSSTVKTHVNNDNDVKVTNNNDQKAKSGDASVEHNGNGGDATTGSATNTNATTITVTVTN
jgi:hypothetical protein